MRSRDKGIQPGSRPVLAQAGVAGCIALGLLLIASAAWAGSHPAAHAPIGVMGDHTHARGEVMLSYRYMRMGMNGLRDEDERISRRKVLQDFMVTPTSMDMEMHMFGVMYAPIDGLTLMLMLPYVEIEMDHRTRGVTPLGRHFRTRSNGIGDLRVSALIDLWKRDHHKLHGTFGISFPSGSITQQDQTPMSGGSQVRLPYPMQIGSGTYDFLPGLTYTAHDGEWSWGAQARGEIRLNENHAGYRLGDEYGLTAWGGYTFTKWLSASIRFEWTHNGNVRGREDSPSVNPVVVPTADPGRRAAMRLDALFGLNFIVPIGPLEGLRFAVEAGLPAYQRLDGPGLETDWISTAGVQYAF